MSSRTSRRMPRERPRRLGRGGNPTDPGSSPPVPVPAIRTRGAGQRPHRPLGPPAGPAAGQRPAGLSERRRRRAEGRGRRDRPVGPRAHRGHRALRRDRARGSDGAAGSRAARGRQLGRLFRGGRGPGFATGPGAGPPRRGRRAPDLPGVRGRADPRRTPERHPAGPGRCPAPRRRGLRGDHLPRRLAVPPALRRERSDGRPARPGAAPAGLDRVSTRPGRPS